MVLKLQMMPMMKAMIKVWKMVEMGMVTVLTMIIQVIIMLTMKQCIKKAMKVAMMMDIQMVNPNMRMKNQEKMNNAMNFNKIV